ncbi:MAG: hypothetical protein AAF518_19400 [Spirochaetota bacterium]
MKSLKLQTLFTSVAMLVQNIFGFLFGILLSRFFLSNPSVVDTFYISYNIYLLFNMFSATQRVSILSIFKADTTAREIAGVSLRIYLLFFVLTVSLALLSPFISFLYLGATAYASVLRDLLLLFALVVFFQGLNGYYSAYLSSKRELNYISWGNIIGSGLGLCCFIALHRFGIYAAAIGFLVTHTFMYCFFLAKSDLPIHDLFSSCNLAYGKGISTRVLQSAAPYLGFNFSFLITQNALKTMDKGFITAFSYAYSLVILITAATTGSIGYTLSIKLAELKSKRSPEQILQYISDRVLVTLLLFSVLLGVLLVSTQPIGIFMFAYIPKNVDAGFSSLMVDTFSESAFFLSFSGFCLGLFTITIPVNFAYANTKGFFRYTVVILLLHLLAIMTLNMSYRYISGLFILSSFLLFAYQPIRMLQLFDRKQMLHFFITLLKIFFSFYTSVHLTSLYRPIIQNKFMDIFIFAALKSILFVTIYTILFVLAFPTKVKVIYSKYRRDYGKL